MTLHHLILFCARLLMIAEAVLSSTHGIAETQQAAPEGEVTLSTALEVHTVDGVLYRVAYEYSFRNLPTVYIEGLGTVPAKGRLAYLSSSRSIEFLDAFRGNTLRAVSIVEPGERKRSDRKSAARLVGERLAYGHFFTRGTPQICIGSEPADPRGSPN